MKSKIQSFQKDCQKGHVRRIKPNKEAEQYLNDTFGCTRFIWNKMHAEISAQFSEWQKDSENNPFPDISKYGIKKVIAILREDPEFSFLTKVSGNTLRNKLMDLSSAYTSSIGKNKVKGRRLPRFKKKGRSESFRLDAPRFRIVDDKYLFIEKCPVPIRIIMDSPLPSTPSRVTIRKTPSGKYYASFLCKFIPEKKYGTKVTGIDVGINKRAVFSDGFVIENPRYYHQSLDQIRKLSRELSRKQEGSKNYEKCRIKLAKKHEYVKNQRAYATHCLTKKVTSENQAVIFESLNIPKMAQNPHLSRNILDAAWGDIFRQTIYKAEFSQNCRVFVVPEYMPSSHTCANTGRVLGRKLKLSERSWECPFCGETHDRDLNAARVLKTLGEQFIQNVPNYRELKKGVIAIPDHFSIR